MSTAVLHPGLQHFAALFSVLVIGCDFLLITVRLCIVDSFVMFAFYYVLVSLLFGTVLDLCHNIWVKS